MLEALATPRNWILTFFFVAICCACAAAAGAIGISDHPPGILLAFLAAAALVAALVHPWRTPRKFRLLLYASGLGFALFVILHNVCEAVATRAASAGALQSLLQGLGVGALFLAVLICPRAALVAAMGWIAVIIRNRRRPAQAGDRVA